MSKLARYAKCLCAGLVVVGLVLNVWAQAQQPHSIKQLFEEDQKDRSNLDYSKLTKEDWQKIQERDAVRREETRQLLASGAVQSGEEYRQASFIFQHGDKPEDFLLAHVLAVAAIAKGDATATWISAATLDRYLQSIKQSQVFGTQYLLKDPDAVLKDPKAQRAVTQDPYSSKVISDELRKVFCVMSYVAQQENLAEMSKGQNPKPDSCH